MIAKFVNGTQIRELFKEAGIRISARKANQIKKELKDKHPDAILPDPNVIPELWIEEVYGPKAYKTKKTDASTCK